MLMFSINAEIKHHIMRYFEEMLRISEIMEINNNSRNMADLATPHNITLRFFKSDKIL